VENVWGLVGIIARRAIRHLRPMLHLPVEPTLARSRRMAL